MDDDRDRNVGYARLKSGGWGLKGKDLTAGELVMVTRKDGKVMQHIVGRIIWRDGEKTLAEIADNRDICKCCGQPISK